MGSAIDFGFLLSCGLNGQYYECKINPQFLNLVPFFEIWTIEVFARLFINKDVLRWNAHFLQSNLLSNLVLIKTRNTHISINLHIVSSAVICKYYKISNCIAIIVSVLVFVYGYMLALICFFAL